MKSNVVQLPTTEKIATEKAIEAVTNRFIRVPSDSTYPRFKDIVTNVAQRDSGILADFYYKSARGNVEKLNGEDLLYKLKWAYGETFQPGGAVFLDGDMLNLWKPHPISYAAPATAEDVALFIEYMERMFPVEDERRYMSWWIAHAIRKPEQKIIATPVLRSEQGTGKTFLVATLMNGIMGDAAARILLGDLVGQFQDSIVGKTVLLIDEMFVDKRRTTDVLKVFQDDKPIPINRKHQPQINVDNYLNLICASNLRDPIYFEPHDRRFYFPTYIKHRVSQRETEDFILRFATWLKDEGGFQKVRNYLESVDLSAYRPHSPAIWTDAKREFLGYSLDEQLTEQLTRLISGVCVVNTRILKSCLDLEESVKFKVSDRKIAGVLADLGCKQTKGHAGNVHVTPLGQERGFMSVSQRSLDDQLAEDRKSMCIDF